MTETEAKVYRVDSGRWWFDIIVDGENIACGSAPTAAQADDLCDETFAECEERYPQCMR